MHRLPHGTAEAPAVSLAQHTEALREELDDGEVFSSLSTSRLTSQPKNASRQYKRAVARFGLSVKLDYALDCNGYFLCQGTPN